MLKAMILDGVVQGQGVRVLVFSDRVVQVGFRIEILQPCEHPGRLETIRFASRVPGRGERVFKIRTWPGVFLE